MPGGRGNKGPTRLALEGMEPWDTITIRWDQDRPFEAWRSTTRQIVAQVQVERGGRFVSKTKGHWMRVQWFPPKPEA